MDNGKIGKVFKRTEWLDKLLGTQVEMRSWRAFAFITTTLSLLLTGAVVFLVHQLINDTKNQKLVLIPALQRKMTVVADSYLTESFIKSICMRVVELQEQWSYETIADNYQELFKYYYSHGLEELTRANLTASDRYNYANQNKMVSVFRFDWAKSRFAWSEKLGRAVGLVSGKRSIFINNNETYSEKDVAYLLISYGVYPDDNNPFAVKMDRIKVDDISLDPYGNLQKQFDAAINGVMPDETTKTNG